MQAADLIAAGRVRVAGQAAAKAATQVTWMRRSPSGGRGQATDYVSRGGRKLAGALAAFTDLRVAGRRCLDAGASTGGFTDVLLRAGAAHVVAVDVGYGQLAWSLRTDPRVTVLDRVNVRGPAARAGRSGARASSPPTCPSSRSTQVLPALAACAAPDADFVLLVKPQFEVGKGKSAPGESSGILSCGPARSRRWRGRRSPSDSACRGVTASPLPGPSGNVEYFLWLRRGAPALDEDGLHAAIAGGRNDRRQAAAADGGRRRHAAGRAHRPARRRADRAGGG